MKFFARPSVIISISALVLVISWFHEGFILGTAEAKIPFYNLDRFSQHTSSAWMDIYLGFASNQTLASGPTWWFLSQIQQLGVPGFLIQAMVFWLLFFSAGMGVYWLTEELFPDLSKKYLILAVFFYWFNPLSLVNVWNRFLYSYMVFWVLLPIALYVFTKGLKERKYIFGIIVSLLLTLFSYALTAYVFNVLLWFVLCFTLFFLLLINFNRKFILFCFKFFLLTLVSFVIFNIWWMLPLLSYVSASETAKELSYFISSAGNVYTLTILSQKLGNLIDIMRFSHAGFYANEGPKWASYYNFPVLIIVLFSATSAVLFGIYRLRKNMPALFLGTAFMLGIFLAEGNNPPFGKIFQFFFEKISILQMFRDPFEKFGFLISLAAAPLFAVGVKECSDSINARVKSLIYPTSLIIVLGVFGYPFFSGLVFTSQTPPNDNYAIGYKVKVPDYYKQADKWLQSQGSNFRFIGFPLGDEGITYDWEKGYQGVESAEILFSTPNVMFKTTIPYFDQVAGQLEQMLFTGTNFNSAADLLNVKYFMVRSDVNTSERRLRDPKSLEAIFIQKEKEGEVKKIAQFGKLTFWENLRWFDKTIYAATNRVEVSSQPSIPDSLFDGVLDNDVLLQADSRNAIKNKAVMTIIYPDDRKADNFNDDKRPLLEDQKKYRFNVTEQANYELVLDGVNLNKEATLVGQLKIIVDNQQIARKGEFRKDNKLSYGQIYLDSGTHEIVVNRLLSQNLILAPAEVILQSSQGKNTALFELADFDPYSRYLIVFDYLIRTGDDFVFMFQQNNDLFRNGNIVPEFPYLNILKRDAFNNFRHANGIFTPGRSEKAWLFFGVNPNADTDVIIKNIATNRLFEPQPVLIKENPRVQLVSPKISYSKKNPTEYRVHITGAENPFVLVFSELYNNGWEAILEDGTRASDHFLANAYANGWLIDKKGDFNLTIKFAPQKLLETGRLISVFSILAALIYIGSILKRKKNII